MKPLCIAAGFSRRKMLAAAGASVVAGLAPKGIVPALAQAPAPVPLMFAGFDNVLPGTHRSTIVKGTSASLGPESSFNGTICTTFEEVVETLHVSNAVSASGAWEGYFGGVDSKQQLVSSLKLTTWSVSIIMGFETGTPWQATEYSPIRIPTLSSDADRKAFVAQYGDSFISEVTLGGFYYAVYTFYAQSHEEQNAVTTALATKGGFEGIFNLTASTNSDIQQVRNSLATRSELHQKLGGYTGYTEPTDGDGIVKFAQMISAAPLPTPAVTSFQTTGYESVLSTRNTAAQLGRIAKTRQYFAQPTTGMNWKYAQLMGVNAQVAWLEKIYDVYNFTGKDPAVANAKGSIAQDLTAIQSQVAQYGLNQATQFSAPPLPSLKLGTPMLAYSIVPAPARWGGGGGTTYDDVGNLGNWLSAGKHISAVHINQGGGIDQIKVTYSDINGGSWTLVHGGNGGADAGAQLQFAPGEYITQVKYIAGEISDKYIMIRLQFITNRGQTYPTASFDADPRTKVYTIPQGAAVAGFEGNAGGGNDNVSLICVQLHPATWQ